MATTTWQAAAPALVRSPYRLSVAQYHRMAEAGILKEGEKVELLEGLLVGKMTVNPPHATAITKVLRALFPRVGEGWLVRMQLPVTTAESEPEPDFAVVAGMVERYAGSHPGPADVSLVIEVADASLDQDRTDKQRIYARARIPVYWIVNLPGAQVEEYTQPRAGRNPAYRRRRDYTPAESIPLVLAGQSAGSIAVRDLLP
jgi:Uma2 family endonuclease